MRLRGYDDYPVTLGDEMRGQRATLGKSLLDAEYDLRIKAHVLRAIEDCDLEGFPNMSVVAGYVRSYARYLGMDADETYRRFCADSGYRSPVAALGGGPSGMNSGTNSGAKSGASGMSGRSGSAGPDLGRSRFAVRPAPARLGTRVSLGALTSALAMLGLIGGLGYGGYALLQDIQRVGFAPLPQGPEIIADAPLISPPPVEAEMTRASRPKATDYEGDGALLAAAPAELPPPMAPGRDGPISAIDPDSSGLFAPARAAAAENPDSGGRDEAERAGPRSPDGPNGGMRVTLSPEQAARAEPMLTALPARPPKVVLHATDEVWIRVRDGEAVIFEGTLQPGGQYEVPERVAAPLLRAGNAGALYALVDGEPYGPVGTSAQVLKNLSLVAADITGQVPEATAQAVRTGPDGEPLLRAEAGMSR